jgi:triacylglycerol lipase
MTGTGRSGRGRATRRVVLAVSGLIALGLLPAATTVAATPDPILLVHGYRGHAWTWQQMIDRFKAEGRTAVAITLPGQDNIVNARAIRDFIAAKGWRRVDIIGQSMGGLSARWFIRKLNWSRVDTYVSIGTPQYGIYASCLLPSSYGGQMCPTRSFIKELNSGDDTPDGIFYTTIYSRGDRVIPTNASRLDGGACHVYEDPGVGHNDMDNDATIFRHILAAVDRVCAGTFR